MLLVTSTTSMVAIAATGIFHANRKEKKKCMCSEKYFDIFITGQKFLSVKMWSGIHFNL